jgi:hypothetical protein
LTDNLFFGRKSVPASFDGFQFIKDNISISKGGENTIDIIDGTFIFLATLSQ